jgi:predicted ABC-type ATPase
LAQLWIVAGPNGAGKTTLVSRRLSRRITVVNPDVIAEEIPYLEGKPDERRAGTIAIERRNALLARRADFAIETTLTGMSALRLIAAARQAGYKVTLVYVGLSSADLSVRRVVDRVRRGGHAVPVAALERRYPDSMAKLAKAIELADRSYVFDNSGTRRRLLVILDGQSPRYVVPDLPAWAIANVPNLQRLM